MFIFLHIMRMYIPSNQNNDPDRIIGNRKEKQGKRWSKSHEGTSEKLHHRHLDQLFYQYIMGIAI